MKADALVALEDRLVELAVADAPRLTAEQFMELRRLLKPSSAQVVHAVSEQHISTPVAA